MSILGFCADIVCMILDGFEKIDEFHCPGKKIKEADFQRLISEMASRQAQCNGDDQIVFHIQPGVVHVYKLFNPSNWNDLSDGKLQQIYQFQWAFGDDQQFIEHLQQCRKEFYRLYDEAESEIFIQLAQGRCTVFSVNEPKLDFHLALGEAKSNTLLNVNQFPLAKSCGACRCFKRLVKNMADNGNVPKLLEAIKLFLHVTSMFLDFANLPLKFVKITLLEVLKWISAAGQVLASWVGNYYLEYAFSAIHAFCFGWTGGILQIVQLIGHFIGRNIGEECGPYIGAKIGGWLGEFLCGEEGKLPGEHIGAFVGSILFPNVIGTFVGWMAGKFAKQLFEEWKKWKQKQEEKKRQKPEEKSEKPEEEQEEKKRQKPEEKPEEEPEEKKRQKPEEKPEEEEDGGEGGTFFAKLFAERLGFLGRTFFDELFAEIPGWLKLGTMEAVCYVLLALCIVLIILIAIHELYTHTGGQKAQRSSTF